MENFSTTSKFVSAGAIMILGLGVSAAVMTSSANADESHSLPKITHVSKSVGSSVIPPAVLPTSIKAPSISRLPSGGEDADEGSSASDE